MMKKKRFALTLIEIMIVIVLIGLIGSVIGANMKGSLDEGRAFKTKYAIEQIKDILMLEVAKGEPIERVVGEKEQFLAHSGMIKDPKKFLKDGWGEEFEVSHSKNKQKILVSSKALKAYEARKNKKIGNVSTSSEVAESDADFDED